MSLAGVLGSPSVADARVEGDTFRSKQWPVQIRAPRQWQLTDNTAYPSVLALMVHRRPRAQMLFSAETGSDRDTLSYATRTAEVLRKAGFRLRPLRVHAATGAYWVDFEFETTALRQAYIVAEGVAYSLTLVAPNAQARNRHGRAFDFSLRSIRVSRTKPSTPTADETGAGENNSSGQKPPRAPDKRSKAAPTQPANTND